MAASAQWLVSVVSWLVLAFVASRQLRHPGLRIATFVVLLGLSLTSPVMEWDGDLLSESLTLSLGVLFVAAQLALVRRPTRMNIGLTLLSGLALVLTRDTNAYLLLVLLPTLAFLLARWGERGLALALATGAVLIVAFSIVTYNVRHWEGPMTDVVIARVIPDLTTRAYFERHGMQPPHPGLWTALVESRSPPEGFEQDPRLASFRPWFLHNMRRTYAEYLVSHPGVSLWGPLRNLPQMIDPDTALPVGLDFFRPAGLRRALPGRLADLFYLRGGWVLVAWLGIAGAVAALLALGGYGRRSWIVPGLLLGSTLPLALIVWDGDPVGVGRHALQLAVFARIGLWLLALFVLDAALER